jgi:hypothetical protein
VQRPREQEGAFFMDPQQCPAILLFTEAERIVIREHNEARGASVAIFIDERGCSPSSSYGRGRFRASGNVGCFLLQAFRFCLPADAR